MPKDQPSLPGFERHAPKEKPPRKTRAARSLDGLTAFFLRCFPDQGRYTYPQTRWAIQKAMQEHGLTVDEMFIRINRMNGKHPTMSPWEVAKCELPERARRYDKDAPRDVGALDTDLSGVSDETREKVMKTLRRQEEEWEEEQL